MTNYTPGLLVDFDGTLCFDHFWRSMGENHRASIQQLLFHAPTPLVEDWKRGFKTSEDVARHASSRLAIPYDDLWACFREDCASMHVEPHTLRLIGNLRTSFRTLLVTDNMDSFDRFTRPALDLDRHFHAIANSAALGVLKGDADGGLFKRVVTLHALDIGRSHLIDNSEEACRIFTALGGHSHLVRKPKDVDAVLTALA